MQAQGYASGDTVNYIFAQPGDLVYLHLADTQTAVVGSVLGTSATAGMVKVEATAKDLILVAIAEEAVTTSGATARIKAHII